jgi:hypothetical protein
VAAFAARTELATQWMLARLGVLPAQCYRWYTRYGQRNAHNGQNPRAHWLTPEEQQAILRYHDTPLRRRATDA